MNCFYYHELNFLKNMAVLIISHKIWTAPTITSWTFRKKYPRFNEVTLKFALLLLSRGKIFAKNKSFANVTWKLDQPLLSQVWIFDKIRQFWWCQSKNWIGPIIKRWNLQRYILDRAVLMMSYENLTVPSKSQS